MFNTQKAKKIVGKESIFEKTIKVLRVVVLTAIFVVAYLFAIGSGKNPGVALLVGLVVLVAILYLMSLLAPFFFSISAFLWFIISLASLFLVWVATYSQWNRTLAWNKQTTGFYLTAALLGLTIYSYLFYAWIVFKAFLSTIIYFFKKLLSRIIKIGEEKGGTTKGTKH